MSNGFKFYLSPCFILQWLRFQFKKNIYNQMFVENKSNKIFMFIRKILLNIFILKVCVYYILDSLH